MYRKSMREALEEARAYRDTTKDTTEGGPPTDGGPGSGAHNHKKPRNLTKTAKGIAFSPKYRGGDYSGAYKAINKIKKGLAAMGEILCEFVDPVSGLLQIED